MADAGWSIAWPVGRGYLERYGKWVPMQPSCTATLVAQTQTIGTTCLVLRSARWVCLMENGSFVAWGPSRKPIGRTLHGVQIPECGLLTDQ